MGHYRRGYNKLQVKIPAALFFVYFTDNSTTNCGILISTGRLCISAGVPPTG